MITVTPSRVRRVLGVALVVSMTLCWAEQVQARRRHHHHPRHSLYFGFYHAWPPYYYWSPYYAWPPYYWPYPPYDYYGPYDDWVYAPSERRRFPVPAFRLPGLFHYPGALAKDEPIGSAPEQPVTPPPQPGQGVPKP
jgi:hypothetical protein